MSRLSSDGSLRGRQTRGNQLKTELSLLLPRYARLCCRACTYRELVRRVLTTVLFCLCGLLLLLLGGVSLHQRERVRHVQSQGAGTYGLALLLYPLHLTGWRVLHVKTIEYSYRLGASHRISAKTEQRQAHGSRNPSYQIWKPSRNKLFLQNSSRARV